MTFDLQKILESKRALRRNLVVRPVAEKLRILDSMRERELAIRGRAPRSNSSGLGENPKPILNEPEISSVEIEVVTKQKALIAAAPEVDIKKQ